MTDKKETIKPATLPKNSGSAGNQPTDEQLQREMNARDNRREAAAKEAAGR